MKLSKVFVPAVWEPSIEMTQEEHINAKQGDVIEGKKMLFWIDDKTALLLEGETIFRTIVITPSI